MIETLEVVNRKSHIQRPFFQNIKLNFAKHFKKLEKLFLHVQGNNQVLLMQDIFPYSESLKIFKCTFLHLFGSIFKVSHNERYF